MVPYEELLRSRGIFPKGRLLSIDPGMTTGWSVWVDGCFDGGGQIQTNPDITLLPLVDFIKEISPEEIVMEKYTIYQSKLKQHSGSDVPTLRLIGAIELICEIRKVPITYQSAGQAKQFCNDSKLVAWGLWREGKKHMHDSIRHALYYFLFSSRSL